MRSSLPVNLLHLKPTFSGGGRRADNNEYVDEPSSCAPVITPDHPSVSVPATSPATTSPEPTTQLRLADLFPPTVSDRLGYGGNLSDRSPGVLPSQTAAGLSDLSSASTKSSSCVAEYRLRVPPAVSSKDRAGGLSSSTSSLRAAVTHELSGVTCKLCGGCRCASCQRTLLLCTCRRTTFRDQCRCAGTGTVGGTGRRRGTCPLMDCVVPCLCSCWIRTVSSCVRRCTGRPHVCRCSLTESL